MNDFFKISVKRQTNAIESVANSLKIIPQSIEKDLWVTAVLRALFSLPYAENLSFKGGTSLSKCYNLIERFSEDIDIAVDRDFLGFGGILSKTQINDKLRRAACSFVREKLQFDVATQLENQGIKSDLFAVKVNITPVTTTDPEIIEVHYKSHYSELSYLKPIVKIEVSGRSMNEPLQKVFLQSFVDEVYPNTSFADKQFEVNAVAPERTFLEKIFLLHEEFAKPQAFSRTDRMSRHLYDIVKLEEAGILEKALLNKKLYYGIVEHRRIFIGLMGFNYSTLFPQTIQIVPPESFILHWKSDYEKMQETMIYGKSLPFDKLIDKVRKMNEKINKIKWQ